MYVTPRLKAANCLFGSILACLLGILGCDTATPTNQDTTQQQDASGNDHDGHDHDHDGHDDHDHDGHDHDHDGHDHDHDGHDHDMEEQADSHDHELGPNQGHLVRLQPGDVQAEWVLLDQKNEVQIILDKKTPPVKSVSITIFVGDQQLDPYVLEAADPAPGSDAPMYQLVDEALTTQIKMTAGAGTKAWLIVESDSGEHRVRLEHHAH